jgi:hypothetical protein
VQRIEQPAIGAPAAIDATEDVAGDRTDVKPGLRVVIEFARNTGNSRSL